MHGLAVPDCQGPEPPAPSALRPDLTAVTGGVGPLGLDFNDVAFLDGQSRWDPLPVRHADVGVVLAFLLLDGHLYRFTPQRRDLSRLRAAPYKFNPELVGTYG